MNGQKTLIFIGAHPDDETFGVGGTLAQYAATGVKVYYVCATRGEAGITDVEHMRGYSTSGDMRWAELKCAARILGLTDVIYLGYRDSGMPGTEDNKHPDALVAAPIAQVTGRVVKAIRELQPEVVITFDPIGGYRHPDHIAIHNATEKAFYAASDPELYPDAGPAFKPQKLYFNIFPRRLLKIAVKLMPVFGKNPHHFGKNKDIDLTSMVNVDFPVNASIRLNRNSIEIRDKAMSCHGSQLVGGSPRRGVMGFINNIFGQQDFYMRAYPQSNSQHREHDLFEGL